MTSKTVPTSPTQAKPILDRRFCVAPMLDWTDRHCRYFHRILSQHAVLYTEMVTTGAILHGDKERFLRFNQAEHPIALQLGGSDPDALAECAKIAEGYGYDEINLNVGCPSDRVQNGRFGACLMADPNLVADCVNTMQANTSIPVTVKHRIGIDDMDSYQLLYNFVKIVASAGCSTFIVHARKAILSGLSPKQNREVPPLNYPMVYQLKQDFPHLEIIINGGIKTLSEAEQHLSNVDGVMIGREAYQNPYMLAEVDQHIFQTKKDIITREQVMEKLHDYCKLSLNEGDQLKWITRHILGLYQGERGAKVFRRYLSENAYKTNAGLSTLENAIAAMTSA